MREISCEFRQETQAIDNSPQPDLVRNLDSYQFDDFTIDHRRFELRLRGQSVPLERKPLQLLILLASGTGLLVSLVVPNPSFDLTEPQAVPCSTSMNRIELPVALAVTLVALGTRYSRRMPAKDGILGITNPPLTG